MSDEHGPGLLTGAWVHIDILADLGEMGKVAVTWSSNLNQAAAVEVLGSAAAGLGYGWDIAELDP